MEARIFRPPRSVMQAGQANTRRWLLEFEPRAGREIDSLMGWTSSADTDQQVTLSFDTCEEAVAYAARHGIAVTIEAAHERRPRPRSYAENFRYVKVG
ncbi:MAG: ETC complex I subunit [Alphaproteobacteria bacterium]|nr:ETC complex I subunit [Alphaproteobacteria bacterium]